MMGSQLTKNDWAILERHGITPDNLSVGGALDLRHTGITALPDNLSVDGDLDLSHTGITALPDNLSVGEWLFLSHTSITALPDNLSVGESLDLAHTSIKALYKDDRGYRLDRAGNSYIAGCRNFTAEEALDHWGSEDYRNKARGAAFCAAVRAEEAKRKGQRK